MKIVSFNINSIRARPHQIEHLRDTIDPDVIGLQETKVNDPEFPIEVINDIGYHVEYHGQKGHYGVAILSKSKPLKTVKGFKNDTEEDQKRFIQSTFKYGNNELPKLVPEILAIYLPVGIFTSLPTDPSFFAFCSSLYNSGENISSCSLVI